MKKLEGRPFALIGVNVVPHDAGKLAEVMEREKLTWRSFDDPGSIARAWNLSGTPTFYLIDAEGVIRHKWVGSPGDKALDAAIEALVREAEAKASE